MKETAEEIQDQLNYCKQAIGELKTAVLQKDVRRAWGDFLMRFSRAIGKLISASIKHPETRSFGYKLKNSSLKDDPGLLYLREARNVDDHGIDEPSADYQPAQFSFMLGIVMDENSSMKVGKLVIGGVDYGSFQAGKNEHGNMEVHAHPKLPTGTRRSTVTLLRAINPEKEHFVPPPSSVFGQPVGSEQAQDLAYTALDGLQKKLTEYQLLLNSGAEK